MFPSPLHQGNLTDLPHMHQLPNNSNMFKLFFRYKISLVSELEKSILNFGSSISFLHSNSYYLTGILSYAGIGNNSIIGYTNIKYHIQWIRGVVNKHVSKYISL